MRKHIGRIKFTLVILGSGDIKKFPLEGGKTSSLASATKELELTSTDNVLHQKEILL